MSLEQNQQQPEFHTSDTTEAKFSTPAALREGQSDSENNKRIVYVQDPNSRMVSQVLNPPYEKLGNPGPMGLYSFAITTFMLGLYHCGAGLPNSNPASGVGPDQAVLGTAFFMGGIVQFAAGMWEMRVGNSFGATLHSSCKYTVTLQFLKTIRLLMILTRCCILDGILVLPCPWTWNQGCLQRR